MALFCDVDPARFERRCRVPLLRGKAGGPAWNVWQIWHATDKSETPEQLESHVKAQMARWLGNGNATNFQFGPTRNDWAAPPWKVSPLMTKERCAVGEGARIESGAQTLLVPLRFVYRGGESSRGWPVAGGWLNLECPAGADWLLDGAYAPIGAADIPDPDAKPSVLDELGDRIGGALGRGAAAASGAIVRELNPARSLGAVAFWAIVGGAWYLTKADTNGSKRN